MIIQKQNSNRQHKLIIPQSMKFHYEDRSTKRYNVAGSSETGYLFNTDGGAILDYHKVRAKRKKSLVWKITGGLIAAIGTATAISGLLLTPESEDDFVSGSGPEYLFLTAAGIAITYSGIVLARSRKTYRMDKWGFNLTPAEYVKRPMERRSTIVKQRLDLE